MSEEAVDLRADVEAGEKPEAKPEIVADPWSTEEASEASAMGWNDNRDRLPEGKKFVGPVEYMERNPLYKRMKSMESTLSSVMSHNQKVNKANLKKQESEFNDRIAELKDKKVKALDESDHKLVVEIDEEIRTTEKPKEEKVVDSTLKDWVADGNSWYEDDEFLRVEADIIGERLYYQDGKFGKDLLDAAKKHLKQKYPDKFRNTNRDKPSAVEGASNRGGSKTKTASIKDLTADEKTVFNNWKANGVFANAEDEQSYFNDVIAARD